MILNPIFFLGFLSATIQLLGYIFYIKKTNRSDISPNPTTWLIFAFDTAILVFLEAIAGASIALLLLPFICSFFAMYIAWLVRKSGRLQWPTSKIDSYILISSIFIAIIYTTLFFISEFGFITNSTLLIVSYGFLILSNVNTYVAFIPLLREVYITPEHEHAGPWTVWTVSYSLLTIVTYLEVGFSRDGLILYVYPISCLILHTLVAWLARDSRKIRNV